MKTVHPPAIVEILASRAPLHSARAHLPAPVDSDDETAGNPDDPLVQLAAAAAAEHRQMLARERALGAAQAEHELEMRRHREALQLEREKADIEREKRNLEEGARLLQRKWAELAQMQAGERPFVGPPPELARLAGASPPKPRRASTKSIPPKLDMRAIRAPSSSAFASTATLTEDLPSSLAGIDLVHTPLSATSSSSKRSPARRKPPRTPSSGPLSAPPLQSGADPLRMLTEAAAAVDFSGAHQQGESPTESSGSEWGGDPRNRRRPPRKHASVPPGAAPAPSGAQQGGKACSNCDSRKTTAWRRDPGGNLLCNPCALYHKYHGRPKPIS
ncbi:hypothetical protein DFJ74DRAFT_755903 [Hyaloraphidium curvatum]|nr:hypothetical protein DFJ74DRAFT_755903 [Hyaloraphidium curvatum]